MTHDALGWYVGYLMSLVLLAYAVGTIVHAHRHHQRRTSHGIAIRLTGAAGVLLHTNCEQLGLIYTYGGGADSLDLGGRALQRDAAGWMTLETLSTAGGLLFLQCRPEKPS